MQKHVQRLGVNLHKSLLFGNHLFVDKVAGNFNCRRRGTLAVTRLQHIQLVVLDSELHILHIAVVVFERCANLLELRVSFGEHVLHLLDGHRGANARNYVFALSVYKEFAHKPLFAGSGITRERNARTRSVAKVAERHHLNVYRSTPAVRDIVVHTVDVSAGVVPGTENGFNCFEKLFFGVVGEVFTKLFLIFCLELVSKLLQIVRSKVHVVFDALLFLHFVDELFEVLLAHFHNDVGEHLNKSSVAVPSPTGVARFSGDGVYNVLV